MFSIAMIQQKIKLNSVCNQLTVANPIDVYPQNKEIFVCVTDFTKKDYERVCKYIGIVAPKFSVTGNTGMFGPIRQRRASQQ